MIFSTAFILLTLCIVVWQLWNKSAFSKIFGSLSLILLAITGISVFTSGNSSISQLGYLAFCLFSLSLMSLIASKMKDAGFLKIPFLLITLGMSTMLTKYFDRSDVGQNISYDKENELLVQIKHDQIESFQQFISSNPSISSRLAFKPMFASETILDDYFTVDIISNKNEELAKIISELRNRQEVIHVELNEIVPVPSMDFKTHRTKTTVPYLYNDPMNTQQWALDKTGMNDVFRIIKKAKTVKKAKLFILDTGVDGDHEDIQSVFVKTQKKNDSDKRGHGTHCAGIAGAMTGNNIGISSFNGDGIFTISSIKVLADFGGGTQQGIINGMIKAIDSGADVISMSLGGRSTDNRQKAYNDVLVYAKRKNVIVVVAAGNSSAKAINYSPANSKGVITVAAIDPSMKLASFSNTLEGIEMGISAPGVDILSTFPGNKYEKFSGTSMATPFVAGLLSTMKSYKPDLTVEEAFQLLNDFSINTQDEQTKNIVNPSASLENLLK